MKIINRIIIALCGVAVLLIVAAITLSLTSNGYAFLNTKWHDNPQEVLDSLSLSMADVKLNSGSSNDLARDEKSLISYEAADFVWENIQGELFMTFSEKGLIWVEFRSNIANYDTANSILMQKHKSPTIDDIGNATWGKLMGSGNGVTLFVTQDQMYLNFYAG